MFDFIAHFLSRAMICSASSTGEDEDSRKSKEEYWRNVGLVPSHCYCLTQAERVKLKNGEFVELLQFHNPHGVNYSGRPCSEWNGDYGDESEKWNEVSEEEKRRIGFVAQNEGTFWMPFDQWPRYMFDLTMCFLPSMCPDTGTFKGNNHYLHEISGTLSYQNSPLSLDGTWFESDVHKKVDFRLDVGNLEKSRKRNVLLQLLVDVPKLKPKRYFFQMNLYDKNQKIIDPVMPLSREIKRNRVTERVTGENVEIYRTAGHLYLLDPGQYAGTAYFSRKTEKHNFKVYFKFYQNS